MGKYDVGVFSNIGASNYSNEERAEHDYYSTNPIAIRLLDKHDLLDKDVPYFETACGDGALAKELKRLGYNVTRESDLYDRGYGETGVDFFKYDEVFEGNTITNPPYNRINEWIKHTLKITSNKAYIFCRIQTIESIKRYEIFKEDPPSLICPFVKRVKCYKNGIKSRDNSAVCYAWFIWDMNDDSNETKIKWLI